ncbi:MAG: TIR domain-containing protein [Ignavibacteriaceae bacterium]|nr:TIR domain-containing protein [Ignavibacteriaceae bacterium]
MNPKVFISHASEDKEKFVEEFARKLRTDGIDAWLDKWEMKPGDSIVNRIFEEGIKNANAILIVLSKASVQKPWVREEMNASFVKRIKGETKLIPIIIDDCVIPESLKSTVWVIINDLSNYVSEYNEIKMSILETSNKPALGELPRRTLVDQLSYYNLNKIDSLVFSESCKISFEINSDLVNTAKLLKRISQYDIHEDELFDTLAVLDKNHYIETMKILGGKTPAFSITNYGFKIFAVGYFVEYSEYEKNISFKIVNEKIRNSKEIAEQLNIPHLLVVIILQDLTDTGLIKIQRVKGGVILIINVEVELKRQLRNLL